jgi:hypothetical protein
MQEMNGGTQSQQELGQTQENAENIIKFTPKFGESLFNRDYFIFKCIRVMALCKATSIACGYKLLSAQYKSAM